MTLDLNATLGFNIGDLEHSRDGSRAFARSGSVNWLVSVGPASSATARSTSTTFRARATRYSRPTMLQHGPLLGISARF